MGNCYGSDEKWYTHYLVCKKERISNYSFCCQVCRCSFHFDSFSKQMHHYNCKDRVVLTKKIFERERKINPTRCHILN